MPDPVQLDFSKAVPIQNAQSTGGVQLDFSKAQPATAGPDDPNGNYDFGDLGKVQGVRLNGRAATRQEAFSLLAGQRGVAQTIGNTGQQHQQAMSNFGQVFNPDQQTSEYMGDLAAMGVAGGASRLAGVGKWTPSPFSGSAKNVLPFIQKAAVGNTLGRLPGASLLPEQFQRPTLRDVVNLFSQGSESAAADPVQAAMGQRPISGAPRTILSQLDAANAREFGLQAQTPSTFGSSTFNPSARTARPTTVQVYQEPPAPPQVQAQQTPAAPQDMSSYYGKYSGRSNLSKNQRQMGATAPAPAGPHPENIMQILNTPGDISDADMQTVQSYFAKQKFLNMLRSGTAGK